MAVTGFDLRYAGKLFLISTAKDKVSVEFEPSEFAFEIINGKDSALNTKIPRQHIITFDGPNETIETKPIIIYPTADRFLKPRFGKIATISFEGFPFRLPRTPEEVPECLEALPQPFYRQAHQGLGLPVVFVPIMKIVERRTNVDHLLISTKQATALTGTTFVLSHETFNETVTFMQRVADRHQRRSLQEREAFAHNSLLSAFDPRAYPEVVPPYTEDTIFEALSMVRSAKLKLSEADKTALVSEVGKRVTDLSKTAPDRLFRLHRDIELVNLDTLINNLEVLLTKETKNEKHWQNLFDLNPFILSMIFGYPIVTVLREATVGSPKLDGQGARIADFLVKNRGTSNAALVELKTPYQELLAKRPYRGKLGGHPVFAPNPELAGAVAQVLDQRYRLQKDISTHVSNNDDLVLKTYHVECVVVAGLTPDKQEELQAFEIYRNSLKDVRIITFDELLQKIISLREFLLTSPQPDEPSDEDFAPVNLATDFDESDDSFFDQESESSF